MTAGIPGTGITAMFYVILALLMPFRELYLTVLGRSSWRRWARVLAINAMVYMGAAMMWLTGWALALVVKPQEPGQNFLSRNILSVAPLKIALLTLASVVVLVQIARAIRWAVTRRTTDLAKDLDDAVTVDEEKAEAAVL